MNKTLRPVTLWSRETGQKGTFAYNHLEEGHCENDKPTIKHPDQTSWKNSQWRKEFAHLDENSVVVHSETTTDAVS